MTIECLSSKLSASPDTGADTASCISSPDFFATDFAPRSRPIDIPHRRVAYDQQLPFSNTPPRNSSDNRMYLAGLANLRGANPVASNRHAHDVPTLPTSSSLESYSSDSESMTQFEMDHLLLEETLHLAMIDSTAAATSSAPHQASRKSHSHLVTLDDPWTFDAPALRATEEQAATDTPQSGRTLSYPMPALHAVDMAHSATQIGGLLHPLLQITSPARPALQNMYTSQLTRSLSQISAIGLAEDGVRLVNGGGARDTKLSMIPEESDDFSDHDSLTRP